MSEGFAWHLFYVIMIEVQVREIYETSKVVCSNAGKVIVSEVY